MSKKWAALCSVVLLNGCLAGCAFIKPTTQITVNPATGAISICDTKDNVVGVEVEGLELIRTPDGTTVKLPKLKLNISNNASDVATANIGQMLAVAEQQKAANDGIRAAFEGLTSLAGALRGALAELRQVQANGSITTPWGGGEAHVGPTTQRAEQ